MDQIFMSNHLVKTFIVKSLLPKILIYKTDELTL